MPRARQSGGKGEQYGVGAAGAAAVHAKSGVLRARQGHGFAAERANHLIDAVRGKRVRLVGDDNAKAGPDRIVNNVRIQSKYCASARATVDACFNRNGKPIYRSGRGLMKIEVPKDQYPEVVKLMAKKLRTGDMTAPAARKLAKSVVIEGNIEYATARRLVDAGNIDSIGFDVISGVEAACMAGSLSVAIAFACARWNGADTQVALRLACATGLKVGGVTWLSSVLTAQISKTGAEALVREGSTWMVRQLGSKTTVTLANALIAGERALASEVVKQGGRRLTGKAAEGYLAKIATGNVIAAAATTLILSANDLCLCFSGHISKAQLFKNVTNTAAGVAGGMGGWAWGAVQGAKYLGWIPGGIAAGAAVGSVIGGIVGGAAASAASRQITDWLIEDDAVQMMRHLEQVFIEQARDYVLTQTEANEVMRRLQSDWDLREQMREMFASVDPEQYARWLICPLVRAVAKERKRIRMPSERTLLRCAAQLLEEKEPDEDRTPQKQTSGSSLIIPAQAWPFPTSSRP
jgi:hypothetical protein